eukprot:5201401-Pyramimonas_sp.AAC.1
MRITCLRWRAWQVLRPMLETEDWSTLPPRRLKVRPAALQRTTRFMMRNGSGAYNRVNGCNSGSARLDGGS